MARYTARRRLSIPLRRCGEGDRPAPARAEEMNHAQTQQRPDPEDVLSGIGFVVLLYVYFSFFLGPLNKSRATAEAAIADLKAKLASRRANIQKAANLEKQASDRDDAICRVQGAQPGRRADRLVPAAHQSCFSPISRSTKPPRDSKAPQSLQAAGTGRMDSDTAGRSICRRRTLRPSGKAIAELENTEPLLGHHAVEHQGGTRDPQFQQVNLTRPLQPS